MLKTFTHTTGIINKEFDKMLTRCLCLKLYTIFVKCVKCCVRKGQRLTEAERRIRAAEMIILRPVTGYTRLDNERNLKYFRDSIITITN